MPRAASGTSPKPRVVIVGAGFGGLAATRALASAPVEILLIDRRNYHLFQPLLYQVATAALSPADIAWPIRSILRDQKNAKVMLGRVVGVDRSARKVLLDDGSVEYDYLIVATGARHSYFGHEEWEIWAPGLKKIDDATEIRKRLLLAFERAENERDPIERRKLLNFVVVGGGPTGVELAGAIAELARKALAADFRNIDPRSARILLVEAGARLLPSFPERLSDAAERALNRLGVEVRTGQPVTACDGEGVLLGKEHVSARTLLWAAGVIASPAARWLSADCDRAGRIKVTDDLSVPGEDNVFAIGDTATILDATGREVPGVAPAAKQQGRYVGRLIARRLAGKVPQPAFRYRDRGNLATIGRLAAVADFDRLQLSGFLAWALWCLVHLYFLIGLRSRMQVALSWAWSYLTFQRGARLITGPLELRTDHNVAGRRFSGGALKASLPAEPRRLTYEGTECGGMGAATHGQ